MRSTIMDPIYLCIIVFDVPLIKKELLFLSFLFENLFLVLVLKDGRVSDCPDCKISTTSPLLVTSVTLATATETVAPLATLLIPPLVSELLRVDPLLNKKLLLPRSKDKLSLLFNTLMFPAFRKIASYASSTVDDGLESLRGGGEEESSRFLFLLLLLLPESIVSMGVIFAACCLR